MPNYVEKYDCMSYIFKISFDIGVIWVIKKHTDGIKLNQTFSPINFVKLRTQFCLKHSYQFLVRVFRWFETSTKKFKTSLTVLYSAIHRRVTNRMRIQQPQLPQSPHPPAATPAGTLLSRQAAAAATAATTAAATTVTPTTAASAVAQLPGY